MVPQFDRKLCLSYPKCCLRNLGKETFNQVPICFNQLGFQALWAIDSGITLFFTNQEEYAIQKNGYGERIWIEMLIAVLTFESRESF